MQKAAAGCPERFNNSLNEHEPAEGQTEVRMMSPEA
jgi:hypothetical protein